MGFLFKKGDKSKKENDKRETTDDEHASEGENSQPTTPKVKRRTSVKRHLSFNSMKKIRELANCLQIMGDEVEQKRLSGAYSISDAKEPNENINDAKEPNENVNGKMSQV